MEAMLKANAVVFLWDLCDRVVVKLIEFSPKVLEIFVFFVMKVITELNDNHSCRGCDSLLSFQCPVNYVPIRNISIIIRFITFKSKRIFDGIFIGSPFLNFVLTSAIHLKEIVS